MDSSSKGAGSPPSANPSNDGSNNSALGGAGGYYIGDHTGGTAAEATTLPPEHIIDVNLEVPKASNNYVYAANPDRNSVAVIDPKSLAIQTVAVESSPRGLQTLPNRDAAIVVNTGSSSVSVLTTTDAGTTNSKTLPVMRGANVASVSPNGKYALIYYDSNRPTSGPLADSPQNMSALDLSGAEPAVYQVTVGYHPTAVSFSADSGEAFVVSDDGISIVDLSHLSSAANRLSATLRVYDTTVTSSASVWVSPDGNYAVAHPDGSTTLRLADLTSKQLTDLDVRAVLRAGAADAGVPSTLDVSNVALAPDGKFLLAVVRNIKTLLRVPIPDGFDDPGLVDQISLPNVLTGAVSIGPDGHYALLYTTIDSQNERRVSIVDLTKSNTIQTINLHKMVDGVAFDPTGKTAYVLHVKSAGDPRATGISEDEVTARRYGYSLIDLASATARLQFTDSQPGPVAALPDGSSMFILFPSVAPWSVQRVQLLGFGIDSIGIGSRPTGIGFVPQSDAGQSPQAGRGQVFVSQAQVDGRMTFIDCESLTIKSVAGYELNSSIWE
jgi:YVTN family beta-propeller protein